MLFWHPPGVRGPWDLEQNGLGHPSRLQVRMRKSLAHTKLGRRGQNRRRSVMDLAANLSFMFKERDFLDRFRAAAACGKIPISTRC